MVDEKPRCAAGFNRTLNFVPSSWPAKLSWRHAQRPDACNPELGPRRFRGINGIMSTRLTSGLEQLPDGRDLRNDDHSFSLLIMVSHPVHKMDG